MPAATMSLDLETYSSVDLLACGVYKYTASPDFELLLLSYSWDGLFTECVDLLSGEPLPKEIREALVDPEVVKKAFNASFERLCFSRFLRVEGFLDPSQWVCTMVKATALGLPGSLDKVGQALLLPEDQQKIKTGKQLINYFYKPCKPTKVNKGRTRNLPEHAPEKWQQFKEYNIGDVDAEIAIDEKLKDYPLMKQEQELYALDQRINDRGVRLDPKIYLNAIDLDKIFKEKTFNKAVKLTGLENPQSVAQLKTWLEEEGDLGEVKSIDKKILPKLLEQTDSEIVRQVLECRQLMAKTSVSKYEKMEEMAGADSRVRGMLQFYGASRTGRWSGRGIQPQNLPQNRYEDIADARQYLADGDFVAIEMLYPSVPDALSQLVRTAFIPAENARFIVGDFSAIEARVLSWLADESWRIDVFNSHGKIYEAAAAQMFNVPIDHIKKGRPEYELRAKGKIAELALGYQGAKGALVQMGALDQGLTESELPDIVRRWRNTNPKIVKLWYQYEKAAFKALVTKKEIKLPHGVSFSVDHNGHLFAGLPSGRRLCYWEPKIIPHKKFEGKQEITYGGVHQQSKKWVRLGTYGGKLVENVTQAIARDCLAVAMKRQAAAGYKIVMHVHDESICEVPNGQGSLKEVAAIMGRSISWADGLPLKGDVEEQDFYRK